MFSVLARKQREATISASDLAIAQSDFLLHVEHEYLSVPLDSEVLTQARGLTGKYPLRTLDAIQLACALRATAFLAEPMTFVGSDTRLLTAACPEGFATENPLAHP